jgi:hypothetical protein
MFGTPGVYMRIGDDIRKCVVFLGYPDTTPGRGGIDCIGTGFLLAYKGLGYLVTAKHLSHDLGRDPFLIRFNKLDGTSENFEADDFEWSDHPDPAVDVSVIPMHVGSTTEYDCVYLDGDAMVLSPEQMKFDNIGVGNFTYTLGLFRLLSGEKRNMPICHFGTIGMLPGDEKIPVIDWTDADRKRRVFVEGYLIESQSLGGLSGSPVLVRPEYTLNFKNLLAPQNFTPGATDEIKVLGARDRLKLLGLWQGAWEAPADEVRAAYSGRDIKVPVGMGIVVPCQRIIEFLEMPKVKQFREETLAKEQLPAAVPQSTTRSGDAAPSTDANPTHREDFMRLVDVAARKPALED